MAEHDDDEQKPPLDPDRAAILERRKRFIAVALSGLSTAACTSGPPQSKPDPDVEKGVPQQHDEDAGLEGAAPQPCLSISQPPEPPPQPQPQPPPEPPPQVCLKIAQPPADTGEDDGGAIAPEPAPRPCLRQAAPKPCLKIAKPE